MERGRSEHRRLPEPGTRGPGRRVYRPLSVRGAWCGVRGTTERGAWTNRASYEVRGAWGCAEGYGEDLEWFVRRGPISSVTREGPRRRGTRARQCSVPGTPFPLQTQTLSRGACQTVAVSPVRSLRQCLSRLR